MRGERPLVKADLEYSGENDLGLHPLTPSEATTYGGDSRMATDTAASGSSHKHSARGWLEEMFPLSLMQESLWLHEQANPGTSAYSLPEAWRFRGLLDVAALRESLEAVFLRQESLRTTFTVRNGQPGQVILPVAVCPWEFVDLERSPNAEVQLARVLAADARRPFELAGPLLRIHLFKLGSTDHVLLFNTHHLISDEWSINIFLRELIDHYVSRLAGRAASVLDLPVQYADFAVWQRQCCSQVEFNKSLRGWVAQLPKPLPLLELPTDRPRPARPSYSGATQFARLPEDLLRDLKELASASGATLFMVLAAAFSALLHRLTRQNDVVVGAPFAGRSQAETEGVIGYFVNVLPLRLKLDGDPSFKELVNRMRDTVLAAYDHRDVPLGKLIEAVQPERKPGRHPLFQVVCGLQPAPLSPRNVPGLEIDRIELDNGGSKFDWTVLFTETSQGLVIRSEYSTDLFDRGTMAQWLGCLENLLRGILVRPSCRLSRLPLLNDGERRRMLTRGVADPERAPVPLCLHEWFAQQAEASPAAPAVTLGTRTMTYAELNSRSDQLARYLRNAGVEVEVPVALFLERSLEMLVAILGVLKAGGAYVPIDPACPEDRVRFILEDSEARVLLTESALRPVATPGITQVVCLDSDWPTIDAAPVPATAIQTLPRHAAYIIYTSGSTGKPKGVTVTHQNVTRLFTQTQAWFAFGSMDVWTLFHSYAFDFSVWEMWGALLYGGRLVIVPFRVSRSPGEFYRLLAEEKVTVLNQTPSAFRQLIWAEGEDPAPPSLSLRHVIFGGEALDLQSLAPWFERHPEGCPKLINMYGITETTVHVTFREIRKSDLARGLGSVIGVPIPDLRLYLLDPNLQPVPVGVPGEICVGGGGLARGYLHRPELSAERFIPDPFSECRGDRLYRSGDLARYTAQGELEYLGRMDDQVKIRGYRIEVGEVESALNRHPAVRASTVIAQKRESGGPRLVAYLLPAQGQTLPSDLGWFLRNLLPDYMVPAAFVAVKAFPLTSNGKVDRRALPAVTECPATEISGLPRNNLERLIAETWCSVLERPTIGIHDDFFNLGGHSLLATQAISRLAAALNLDLSVALLFEAPTVALLAEQIGRVKHQPLRPMRPEAPRRLHLERPEPGVNLPAHPFPLLASEPGGARLST
jgi:amino acid adenylation domain-containing protein